MDISSADHRTVLVVEDDDQVRRLIRTVLTNNGIGVLEARTGAEGLEAAEVHRDEIDLLLSDMLLPELSGYDLAVQVRERLPHIQILFMTGYVEGDIVQRCVSELNAAFLDKPFDPHALISRVRELMPARSGIVPG